jgi:hypothetical protein
MESSDGSGIERRLFRTDDEGILIGRIEMGSEDMQRLICLAAGMWLASCGSKQELPNAKVAPERSGVAQGHVEMAPQADARAQAFAKSHGRTIVTYQGAGAAKE